jgi:hypothetical protein
LLVLIVGQVLIVNYLINDFDKRDELVKAAGTLTTNLQAMLKKMNGKKPGRRPGTG